MYTCIRVAEKEREREGERERERAREGKRKGEGERGGRGRSVVTGETGKRGGGAGQRVRENRRLPREVGRREWRERGAGEWGRGRFGQI